MIALAPGESTVHRALPSLSQELSFSFLCSSSSPLSTLSPEDELIAPQLRNMHWCAVTSLSQVSDASFSILCSCGSVSSSSFVHFVLCPCVASRWIDCSSSLVYLPPPSALCPRTNYIIIPSTPWYKMYLSSSSSTEVYPLTEPPSVGTLVTLYHQQDIDQIYIYIRSKNERTEMI